MAMRLALTLSMLGLVWVAVDGAAVIALLAAADPRWILVALLLLPVQTVLSALRWRLTAARLGQDMPVRRALQEYFLAQTVNLTLPGGIVGDASRAVRMRAGVGLERSGQAVLFERLSGQVALVAVTLCAAGLSWLAPGGFAPPAPLVWAFAALAGMSLFVLALLRILAARNRRLAAWGRAMHHAVLHPQVRLRQGLLSLGTVAANVLSFAAAAAAVGLVLPVAAVFSVVPLILFAMLIPFAIGGWGVREGAAVALLPMSGATPEAALAASAAFGMVFLLSSVLGLGLFWAERLLPVRRGRDQRR